MYNILYQKLQEVDKNKNFIHLWLFSGLKSFILKYQLLTLSVLKFFKMSYFRYYY